MNLKAAQKVGLKTIKVPLERSWKAIKELEFMTGELLLDADENGATQRNASRL